MKRRWSRDRGGLIIHINRYPAQAANDGHVSESGIAQHPDDRVIDNYTSLADFLIEVDAIATEFMAAWTRWPSKRRFLLILCWLS